MTDPFRSLDSGLIVFKIGSSLLIDAESGTLRRDWLDRLCGDIATFGHEGHSMIVVSSGAIALGRWALKLKPGPLRLEESQAAAAVGQVRLAQAYAEGFAAQNIVAAQILLTLDDTEERRRYLNARATLATLLELKAVPVINENDTVATAEIRYGDNDRLAARVASMMGANALVLLSDVDGLYTTDPGRDRHAKHVAEVRAITPQVEAMAAGPVSGLGRGGMVSKIAAAKIATQAGCDVFIAKGGTDAIHAMRHGAPYTRFVASTTPAAARKRWIAGGLKVEGALIVDGGAARALADGKSLLPAGVKSIEGRFERGDAVKVCGADGREIARGLAAYSADDARAIAGRRSAEIETILGYRGRDAMIHRDDLAFTGTAHEAEEPQP
jgi:glutamate 5-kinase